MPGLGWAEGGSPQRRAEVAEEAPIVAGLRRAEGGPAPGWAEEGPAPGWAEGFPQGTWGVLKGHPQGHSQNGCGADLKAADGPLGAGLRRDEEAS